MRLLILTQYFPPETGAPQARLSEMALFLKERGVEVEILTAMPNYPAGKIFEGWRGKWFIRDEWRGLSVVRSFIYPAKSPKTLPRLLNYFSFVISSFLAGIFMARRCDIILVESPPLFLGFSGVALRICKRAKMVFNVSDLWPETAVALGLYDRESAFVRLAVLLEKFFYKSSAAVTGQSFGIVRGVLDKDPGARVSLIPNGADCTLFSPEKKDRGALSRFGCDEKIVVGYAGLIGIAQGIGLLIDVARRLENRKDILFLIAGDGPEREALQKQAGPNVVFTGLLQKSDMPAMVASFDMTIIPLRSHIPGALPSKMYEAMASEVPIILAAEGDPLELMRRAECGLHAPYGDTVAVADAVLRLCDDRALAGKLGQAGRAYVLSHHQRAAIAEKLGKTLDAALASDDAFFNAERGNVAE